MEKTEIIKKAKKVYYMAHGNLDKFMQYFIDIPDEDKQTLISIFNVFDSEHKKACEFIGIDPVHFPFNEYLDSQS